MTSSPKLIFWIGDFLSSERSIFWPSPLDEIECMKSGQFLSWPSTFSKYSWLLNGENCGITFFFESDFLLGVFFAFCLNNDSIIEGDGKKGYWSALLNDLPWRIERDKRKSKVEIFPLSQAGMRCFEINSSARVMIRTPSLLMIFNNLFLFSKDNWNR